MYFIDNKTNTGLSNTLRTSSEKASVVVRLEIPDNTPEQGGTWVLLVGGQGDDAGATRRRAARYLAQQGIPAGTIAMGQDLQHVQSLHEQRVANALLGCQAVTDERQPDALLLIGHSRGGEVVNGVARANLELPKARQLPIKGLSYEATPGVHSEWNMHPVELSEAVWAETLEATHHPVTAAVGVGTVLLRALKHPLAEAEVNLHDVPEMLHVDLRESIQELTKKGLIQQSTFYTGDRIVPPPETCDEGWETIDHPSHLATLYDPSLMGRIVYRLRKQADC